jgi:hypothetical protein
MIFGSIFTISGKDFLLNPKIHPAQTATRTPLLHTGSMRRDRQAGPRVEGTPPVSQPQTRTALTGATSPSVRSPVRPRWPTWSPLSRKSNGARGVAQGAREAGRRHAWWSGGVGHRRWGVLGHGRVSRGAQEQQGHCRVLVREKAGREMERRG